MNTKNRLLSLASLAMAMSVAGERGINISPAELRQSKPYERKKCKSCVNLSNEKCYTKPQSRACEHYSPKKK